MKYDENIIITYKCNSCSITNRVINPNKIGGRWKCGKCGTVVLHRKEVFHEALLLDVRQHLEVTLIKLKKIKIPIFSQNKINEIEKINQKCRSKMENWLDHLEYLNDDNKKQEIMASYKPDIDEIQRISIEISEEVQDARWFRDKIQGFDIVRKVVLSTGLIIQAISGIFSFLGLDKLASTLLSAVRLLALEELD